MYISNYLIFWINKFIRETRKLIENRGSGDNEKQVMADKVNKISKTVAFSGVETLSSFGFSPNE